MQGDKAAALRRLDAMLWAIIMAVAVVVAVAAAIGPFHLLWASLLPPAAASVGLMAGWWYYEHIRLEPGLASALGVTAQMVAFAAVGAPLSYIAAASGWPLQDAIFLAADQVLGLDWRWLLRWMNEHSSLHPAFATAYASFSIQASVTIVLLSFARRFERLRVFMLAFFLSALVTIAISAVLPAQGVWGYLGLTHADYQAITPATREVHLATFFGLRDGGFRALMGAGSEGIITFPSLHAALGVIFILGVWEIPILRWAGLGVNAMMIAATPIDGGHYFIDVFAGIGVAVACWAVARVFVRRVLEGSAPAWYAASPESSLSR